MAGSSKEKPTLGTVSPPSHPEDQMLLSLVADVQTWSVRKRPYGYEAASTEHSCSTWALASLQNKMLFVL